MNMKYQLVKNTAWKEVEVNGEMVEIPEDWSLETIKNIATVVSGGTPSTQNPNYWNGSLTWATPVEVGRLNGMYLNDSLKKLTPLGAAQLKNKKLVRDDLIVTTRGTVGNLALAYSDMYCNQSCEALRVKENNSPQYLYFFMKNHKNELVNNSSGTTFNAINKNNILDFFFIKPTFSEQKFIANLLTDQQNLIASYDTLIAQHQKRLDYLSDELLSGRIRLQGGDKGEPYTMVKNTKWKEVEVNGELVEIPEDWCVAMCGDKLKNVPILKENKIKTSDILNLGKTIAISQEQKFTSGFSNNKPVTATSASPHILFGDHSCTLKLVDCEYVIAGDGVKPFVGQGINTLYLYRVLRCLNLTSLGYNRHFSILKEKIVNIPLDREQTAIANVLTQQEKLIEQYRTLRALEQKRFAWLSDALLSGTYRVKELQ